MPPQVTLHIVKEGENSFRLVFRSDDGDGVEIVLAMLALLGSEYDFAHATLQDAVHAGNAILDELGVNDIVHVYLDCDET